MEYIYIYILVLLPFICILSLFSGRIHGSDAIMKREANEVVDIDYNINDPQFCASFAHEIYENLRVTEVCHLHLFYSF